MAIKTKADMYERYLRGDFGNKPITWDTLADYYDSDYDKPVVMRYKQAGSPWQRYGLEDRDAVAHQVLEWSREPGFDPQLVTLNEMLDDTKLTLQGEVYRAPNFPGLYLRYSTVKKPMRLALVEEELHTHGLVAKSLLETFLYPSSYEWLMHLLEEYDGHVIEFSAYSCLVGETVVGPRSHNTFFWEVRDY